MGTLTFLVFASLTATSITGAQADKVVCRNGTDFKSAEGAVLRQSLEKTEGALLLILGFGSLSIILAFVYTLIRRYVFEDVNNVDSAFDAGGNVSTSLTAVTVASQLLWPADLMQSVTMCVKYGIAGAFWYCASAIINMSLFPLLSFTFKTRAPGAKTFLQIIRARFGATTHVIFIVFALLVNVVVLASIFIGGIAVLQATISDASPEFCVLVLATLCGSYAFIGGLGSTFYVSYFNAATTFIVLSTLAIKVLYSDDQPFGTMEEIFARANCQPAVKGNIDGNRFTFLSENAMIFAVQGLFLVSSITYCDQASWQSRVAAKPLQGALGFLLGSFIWFAIPATIGIITGIPYIAETARNQSFALSLQQIDSGVVSAYMAEKALGANGGIMMLTMLTMLTMSTGSGEIMGVTSIIVYDIYQTYIRPFRSSISSKRCICCGLQKPPDQKGSSSDDSPMQPNSCECPPVIRCQYCKEDVAKIMSTQKAEGQFVVYTCPHHRFFRMYQDSLLNFKNWCVLGVAMGLIPFGLFLHAVNLDLNWMMLTGIVFTVPSFPGVILAILWVKTTHIGMIAGSTLGLALGLISDLLVSSFYYHWEDGFGRATSSPYSVLAGSGVGFMMSLVLTIVVSLATHKIKTEEDANDEWQKLRDIDNPLHSWSSQFAEEYPELSDGIYRPSVNEMEYVSRYAKYVGIGGSILFCVIFFLIIPGALASLQVLSYDEFKVWTGFLTAMLFISTVAIVIVTPVEEIRAIVSQIRKNRNKKEWNSEEKQQRADLKSRGAPPSDGLRNRREESKF